MIGSVAGSGNQVHAQMAKKEVWYFCQSLVLKFPATPRGKVIIQNRVRVVIIIIQNRDRVVIWERPSEICLLFSATFSNEKVSIPYVALGKCFLLNLQHL